MDAFFASVEERDKPYLKGYPVIVGADPKEGTGRGVVSTANYKARELGIGSALPIQKAWKLCEVHRAKGGKRCVFVTSGFSKYGVASKEVFSVVNALVAVVSQVSVDEAYLEFSQEGTFEKAKEKAQIIKRQVKKKTGLTCSIGIGPNKMIAKIASDYEKPNGLTVITPEEVEDFLRPLSIRAIPGIGVKAQEKLNRLGIQTIADAQEYPWEFFESSFGKHGFSMWERFRGIDSRPVTNEESVRKSIGKHHTFNIDTVRRKEVQDVLKEQCADVYKELKHKKYTEFKTVVLTVRFSDFKTTTRSLTRAEPMTTLRDLELKATKLMLPFFDRSENPEGKAIRLVGIRVEKLV